MLFRQTLAKQGSRKRKNPGARAGGFYEKKVFRPNQFFGARKE
jgi:hypothetical protein